MEEFVIGMPLNMNGTKGVRAERTEEFAKELAAAFPDIPYHFWDERLTTVIAQKQLIAADVSRKKRKKSSTRWRPWSFWRDISSISPFKIKELPYDRK